MTNKAKNERDEYRDLWDHQFDCQMEVGKAERALRTARNNLENAKKMLLKHDKRVLANYNKIMKEAASKC